MAEEANLLKLESEQFCHGLAGRATGDEFIKQLAGQQWTAFTYFLFRSESWHIATKPLCSREGKGESCWEQRLERVSFSAIPPGLLHCPAKQNKELLSVFRPKEKTLSGITVMIREVIFLFMIHLCW